MNNRNEIRLAEIYPRINPERYKLHLACWNGEKQPLDIFVCDRTEWDGWNAWRGKRDDFNRDFIFSLIDFYPEEDRWLFGGAYRVISRKAVNYSKSYKIELLEESKPFIGRLKISLKRPSRAKSVNLERFFNKLVVTEILSESYTGEEFPGYDKIDIRFPMLKQIIQRQRTTWRAALENAKGVYLITDTRNRKKYVGSAYGTAGVWSRWECYAGTGHGYNDELTKLLSTQRGLNYARINFSFALLEYFTMKTDDAVIVRRESYWKDVLFSRVPHGYNKN